MMGLLSFQKNSIRVRKQQYLTLVEILLVILITGSTLVFGTTQVFSWWQKRSFLNTVEHLKHEIQKARDVMFFFDKDVTLTFINVDDGLEVSWNIFPFKENNVLKNFLDERHLFKKVHLQENVVLQYASRGSILPQGKINCSSTHSLLTAEFAFNNSMGRHAFKEQEGSPTIPPDFPICPLKSAHTSY